MRRLPPLPREELSERRISFSLETDARAVPCLSCFLQAVSLARKLVCQSLPCSGQLLFLSGCPASHACPVSSFLLLPVSPVQAFQVVSVLEPVCLTVPVRPRSVPKSPVSHKVLQAGGPVSCVQCRYTKVKQGVYKQVSRQRFDENKKVGMLWWWVGKVDRW